MALFKAVVWALIFLTKLRFPPGVSIAIVLNNVNCCKLDILEGTQARFYGTSLDVDIGKAWVRFLVEELQLVVNFSQLAVLGLNFSMSIIST